MAQAGEPSRPPWEPRAAGKYLDERAAWWLGWSGSARGAGTACVACHTGLPFALARPALRQFMGEPGPGEFEGKIIDGIKKRVDNWDEVASENDFKAFYSGDRKPSALGTESVLNALILVNLDKGRKGSALSAPANQALDHMWACQQEKGTWLWLNFGLRPWETGDEYYGAALAAVAAGMAGNAYHQCGQVQDKIDKLHQYLRHDFASQTLHNRIVALWASAELQSLLTAEDKRRLLKEISDAQTPDGGWNLADLGPDRTGQAKWKAQGEYPPGARGDGYATGLIMHVLARAGVAKTDANLQAGRQWLVNHQDRDAGTWPAVYLNRNRDASSPTGKFMRDAATSFAVLGLTASDP
jgi:squalene-hopene/tetraprenyl-beta-curcumene cyclase